MTRVTASQAILLAGALGWMVATTSAQTPDTRQSAPPATATIAVDARLVNLPVVIHDKKGALVQNLTKEDFVLQVDGHPQAIRYFDKDNNLPLTLGLLVDTSRSVAGVLDDERTASVGFLDGMLASEKDHAFIIQFAHQTELLQDTTNSRPKLQAALKELDTDSPGTRGTQTDDPDSGNGSRGRSSRGGTTLYDAAFLASDELMSKQTGRKAIILLTDGDDRGSKESLTSAIEAAQRANTIVYAIYFKGQEQHDASNGNPGGGGGRRGGGIGFPGGGYPGGGGGGGGNRGGNGGGRGQENHVDGKKILERITSETGGRLFEISKKETVAVIYGQIAEELRSQYRIGFTPDKDTAAEGYHQVDLALPKSKNLFVQTRDGYYTGTSDGGTRPKVM